MNNICRHLDEYIGQETEYWDFWGAIRIVKGGKILWETSRGYSCAEFGLKNTLSTRFRADQQGICIEAEQKKDKGASYGVQESDPRGYQRTGGGYVKGILGTALV